MSHDPITTFLNLLRVEFAKFESSELVFTRDEVHLGLRECLWSAQHAYQLMLNDELEEQLRQARDRNR